MVVCVSEHTGMPSPTEHDQWGAVNFWSVRECGGFCELVISYPCPCNRIKQEPLYVL